MIADSTTTVSALPRSSWRAPAKKQVRAPIVRRSKEEVQAVFLRLEPIIRNIAASAARRCKGTVTHEEFLSAAYEAFVHAMSREHRGEPDRYCVTFIRYAVTQATFGGDKQWEYAFRENRAFRLKTFTRMSGGNTDFDYASTLGDATDEQADAFTDLIEPLAGMTRIVIKLHYFADMTLAEIAAHLGEPVEAIQRLHASALGELRKALAPPPPFSMDCPLCRGSSPVISESVNGVNMNVGDGSVEVSR